MTRKWGSNKGSNEGKKKEGRKEGKIKKSRKERIEVGNNNSIKEKEEKKNEK